MVAPTEDVDKFLDVMYGRRTISRHQPGHHVLAPTHAKVDMLNTKALERMPAEVSLAVCALCVGSNTFAVCLLYLTTMHALCGNDMSVAGPCSFSVLSVGCT